MEALDRVALDKVPALSFAHVARCDELREAVDVPPVGIQVVSSKMLRGASQTVSKIRVKYNGR